jgi:hypothetical protein
VACAWGERTGYMSGKGKEGVTLEGRDTHRAPPSPATCGSKLYTLR